jgi:uncharacterized protein (DUF58 family)
MNAVLRRSRFLDLRALAALERMRFTTRHRIEGAYSGRHESRRQGGAGEFFDFREYSEGEDLRRLDWKVYARTGRAYLRLYQDETNLLCTLAIDASGSMRFGGYADKTQRPKGERGALALRSVPGSPFAQSHGDGTRSVPATKLEYAQYLATALSHIVARGQDQVGLAVMAGGLREFMPPAGTASHAARVQEAIEALETEPATDLGAALRELFPRVGRRGVLLVMSDFLVDDLEGAFAAVRLFRHRHWEVVALHLVHPDEEQLPDGAAFRFEGLEADGLVDCTPGEIRALYRERFEAHAAMVRSLALAAGCDYRRVSTATPYLQTLGGFLIERAG